jgi:hypothetical protein
MFAALESYIEANHKQVACVHLSDNKFELHYLEQKVIVRYDPSQYIFFDGLHGNPAGFFSFDRSPDGKFSLLLKNGQRMDVVAAADHLATLTMTASATLAHA